MSRVLVVGDTCPMGRNQLLFQRGDDTSLLNDLLPEFEAADLAIANLECPLIRNTTPMDKCGPHLGAPVDCANGLKAMGIDAVALANNHIMDHGPEGLRTTIRTLEKNGIHHVGAGENLEAARKILIREVQGVRIGILALAEHEFGIASSDGPGASPFDIVGAVRNINGHRGSLDHLIVLLHAGNEQYPYPRPSLMDTCHLLVELGASAVICQHSHCAGCMETFQGVPIIYGQGNFLFDYPSRAPAWHEGVLIRLETNEGGSLKVRLIPYRQSDGQPGARRMTADEEKVFMNDFAARSEAIGNESFITRQWESFCRENKRYYLHSLHGKPGFLRRVAGKLDLLHFLDSRDVQRTRLHFVRCESLREALITVLTREAERK